MNNIYKFLLITQSRLSAKSIRYVRNFTRNDPGISKRGALLEGDIKIDEDLDDLEAQFFDLGKSHKQHNRELEASKELKKFHIVRQKYFKEKYPNFLTWADKQQIKFLHQSDEEEWTIERLSEGFPALPETIQKILKNNWIPKNENRVKNHDAAVQENWKNFKAHKLENLPSDLCNHLNKFTSRELNLNPNLEELNTLDIRNRELVKQGGEFSRIIQSYEELKAKTNKTNTVAYPKQLSDGNSNTPHIETNLLNEKQKKLTGAMLTYTELQREIGYQSKHDKHSEVLPNKKTNTNLSVVHDDDKSKEITLKIDDSRADIVKFKSESHSVNLYKPKRDYSKLMYPEHIRIPAELRKNGYTYKLNDCFYDSDGEFLYRVPGMY